MNVWGNTIVELLKQDCAMFEITVSDTAILLDDAISCWGIALLIGFCMLCAWDDKQTSGRCDQASDFGPRRI